MTSTSGSYDAKRFSLCAPWWGERGKPYQQRFMTDFRSACMARSDDYATWEQHLDGEVPGGGPRVHTAAQLANPTHVNAPRPHQGTAADVRKSEAAFYNREASVFAAFRKHCAAESIQIRIDELRQLYKDGDFIGGAPVTDVVIVVLHLGNAVPVHPVYRHNHPQAGQPLSPYDLAAYQKCGNSLTRHIIYTIGLEAMPDPSSGLTQLDAENRWANIKMSQVGTSGTTPRDLAAHIGSPSRLAPTSRARSLSSCPSSPTRRRSPKRPRRS